MRFTSFRSNFAPFVLALFVATALVSAEDPGVVPYPEGFRTWRLIKTKLVGPESKSFQTRGGIHHFWANEPALEGYRTGRFPNGSVLIEEILIAKEGEGDSKGILSEGERRSLDVMMKNDRVYTESGGWGFETFKGESKATTLTETAKAQCHACHARKKDKDSVFTENRY